MIRNQYFRVSSCHASSCIFISEFIYGGMDGIITTIAIISSVMGANISTQYALVLGMANVLSDGFSMGISGLMEEKL